MLTVQNQLNISLSWMPHVYQNLKLYNQTTIITGIATLKNVWFLIGLIPQKSFLCNICLLLEIEYLLGKIGALIWTENLLKEKDIYVEIIRTLLSLSVEIN